MTVVYIFQCAFCVAPWHSTNPNQTTPACRHCHKRLVETDRSTAEVEIDEVRQTLEHKLQEAKLRMEKTKYQLQQIEYKRKNLIFRVFPGRWEMKHNYCKIQTRGAEDEFYNTKQLLALLAIYPSKLEAARQRRRKRKRKKGANIEFKY